MRIIGKLEEGSSQRRIVYDKYQDCPTLQSTMGKGGGNVPLIIVEVKYNDTSKSKQ